MNSKEKDGAVFFLFLLVSILSVCDPTLGQELSHTTSSIPTVGPAQWNDYEIGSGDLLEIRVVGQSEVSGKYRVSEAGQINLPFIGLLQVEGLTETQLHSLLHEKLLKFLRKPELTVTVAEYNSKFVTIIGAVRTPGRYSLHRTVSLFDVIGMAGGMNERAGSLVNLLRSTQPIEGSTQLDKETIQVFAIDLNELFRGRSELNYIVQPGDFINVPEADTIYVTGSVNKPGPYNTKVPVTLTQAIALAGGMTPSASRSQISLFRLKSGGLDREELTFRLSDLDKRKVKDPLLLPNDVIYVRGSESKNIGLAFLRAVIGGVGTSIGIWTIR